MDELTGFVEGPEECTLCGTVITKAQRDSDEIGITWTGMVLCSQKCIDLYNSDPDRFDYGIPEGEEGHER